MLKWFWRFKKPKNNQTILKVDDEFCKSCKRELFIQKVTANKSFYDGDSYSYYPNYSWFCCVNCKEEHKFDIGDYYKVEDIRNIHKRGRLVSGCHDPYVKQKSLHERVEALEKERDLGIERLKALEDSIRKKEQKVPYRCHMCEGTGIVWDDA